jgi:hypothetical protein
MMGLCNCWLLLEKGKPLRVWSFLVLLLFGVLLTPAEAQTGSASLLVHVLAEADEPLPGVTVEVVNSETGLRRRASTDLTGGVVMIALPPGLYEVIAGLEGMDAPAAQAVSLHVGQRARLTLELRPQVTDAVTVTGEVPLVDIYRTDSSTSILPQQIESLPVADRQFEKLAFLAPGVQRDRTSFFDRTDAPVIGGVGNAGVATILVDGIDFTDAFTGQSRQRLSQDSIREFRVVGQGFDAEIGGTAGGGLSVVTKSGTNTIQGTVFAFARDEALRATKEMALEQADYSRTHLGFTVGGPLAADRTHYFGAFEHVDEDEVALVRPGGAFAHLAVDVVRPRRQTTALCALDHITSESGAGSLKLFLERYRRSNYEVGGVVDESHGWSWNRDVWTLAGGHTWVVRENQLNEVRVQVGERRMWFPGNSTEIGEWFSSGFTLKTGSNYVGTSSAGALTFFGLRDTYHWQLDGGSHDLKAGLEFQYQDSSYREPRFEHGLMVYESDTRDAPYVYMYGIGSGDSSFTTNLYGLFVQDEWRPRDGLTISAGLRYDLDSNSNLPDFVHPLAPRGRSVDTDNLQPRFSFNWDAAGDGKTMVRGGLGHFVGRYNQYVTHLQLIYNELSGRVGYTRLGFPGLPIDLEDPENTGFGLGPEITLLQEKYSAPESWQGRLGVSRQLGSSRLFLDAEAVYSEGKNEPALRDSNWNGNETGGWANQSYGVVNLFSNEGRSRYKGLSVGLKGTLARGHLITASILASEKFNISDDPLTHTRPSDPADIDAEWGRAGTDEKYRLMLSGIFRLPWQLSLATIYEYGSGRPWDPLYGYDRNRDTWSWDRLERASRNDQDGPRFSQLDVMLKKEIGLRNRGRFDLSLEVFNLLNTVNYDVRAVDNARYSPLGPAGPYVVNTDFGAYRDTHRPREVQLGLRWRN